MRHIQKLASSGAVQTALDQEELGKPYMAYLEDEHRIDWNSLSPTPTENWVDIRTIDNNTPIYNVAWCDDFLTTNNNDSWLSEKSGLTTDSVTRWRKGKTEATGFFTYHRFNIWLMYTCTFDPQYKTGDGVSVEYGVSVRDDDITKSLPTKEINGKTYYTLNIVDWNYWVPLYAPFSTEMLQSDRFPEGGIMVDIAPKS